MELPIEMIQKYKISIPESEDNIQVYGLSYNDHYIGIKISRVVETQNTWNIFTPGGIVISLFKNSHFIHISCL